MLTYPKKFPEVALPTYQTAIVLRKRWVNSLSS
jgi:hypothetical protein